jgi:beta-lactamase regulating signal transducer with metallopeptidase domain
MNIETPFVPLLDLLVKSAALILISTALLAVMRKASAANRHAVSAAIFGALLLLPFTKLVSARWSFVLEKAAAASVNVRLPVITTASTVGERASVQPVENVAHPAPRTLLVIPWKKLVVAVWIAGAALLLTRRGLIALKLRAIVRSSFPIENERLAAKVRSLVDAGRVRAEVRESDLCLVPLASGIVRPVVLLPIEAAEWSDAFVSSALRHELGHIRRRDCITRLLADVLCVIYWMNPLVWFAARQMRIAQEQACDDLVLISGAPADEYASQLVDVVRSLQGDRFTARHALAMAQPSTLETRVRAIVDEGRDRSPRGARATVAGCLSAAFTLAICLVTQVRGADQDKAVDAMRRGLAFLATQQQDDGSVGSGQYSGSIALTSLAGLALMADDTQAERVTKAAKFILSAQRDDGFIAGKSMYDHGYATLFLAEYFKATARAEVKDSLAKAVVLIVKSQGKDGGWRYIPAPTDGDTSVSACQLMALVAARNAGVDVPAATFSAGVGFLKRCQNPDGGFGYIAPGVSAFTRSAASLSASLATAKWTEPASRPDGIKGADYLMAFLPQPEAGPEGMQYFFHGHYYAAQALQLVGGDRWKRWQDSLRENLISNQKADGSWADTMSVELATSEACLTLQIRNSIPAIGKSARKSGTVNHP